MLGINGAFGSLGRALMPSVVTFLLLFFGSFKGMEVIAVYVWVLSVIIYFGMLGFVRPKRKSNNTKKKMSMPGNTKKGLYSALIPIFFKRGVYYGYSNVYCRIS